MDLSGTASRLTDHTRPHPWYVISELDLAPLLSSQETWLSLCDALERFCDLLPQWPPAAALAALRKSLFDLAARSSAEENFFERLMLEEGTTLANRQMLELLERRRLKRVAQNYELLGQLSEDAPTGSAGLTGYMLRRVVEEVRDAIVVERIAILLLADRRLAAGAREAIIARLI